MLVLSSIFDICYSITLSAYSWSGWTGRDDQGNPFINGITDTINGTTTNIASVPLYSLRSGLTYSGSLHYAGAGGYYWSSTTSSTTYAYRSYFTSSNISPAAIDYCYVGHTIRRVAR